MASMKSANELLAAEIKDLYSAEKQLTKAIPKMIAGAKDPQLKAGLSAHLDETRQQIVRLETIAALLEIKATGKVCKGMEGLILEGAEALAVDAPSVVFDLGIIAAARRVEHYEMAGYMTAIAISEELELSEVTKLLTETLVEEKGAEESLRSQFSGLIATSVSGEVVPGKLPAKRARNLMAKTA
jgi:ferritin-like metal-binding protein YciE